MTNLRDLLKHPILSEISQTKVSFLGFDDSEWFNNETYYLLEIDQDGDAKIIDSGVIKERLEAKAERYNELAQKDKEFFDITVMSMYSLYYKEFEPAWKAYDSAYLDYLTEKYYNAVIKTGHGVSKALDYWKIDKQTGWFGEPKFTELKYEVKTIEKGFYEKNSE